MNTECSLKTLPTRFADGVDMQQERARCADVEDGAGCTSLETCARN